METDKNYFLVGLFVLLAIVAGLAITLWLSAAGQGEFNRYRIKFADSVSGLAKESTVKYRGVDVGNVEDITIDPQDPQLVRVDIRVRNTTPIKTDTVATLRLQGITGSLYVELSGGSDDAPPLRPARHGELPEIAAEKSSLQNAVNELPDITKKTERLLDKANRIADQIGKIFSDENIRTVNSIVRRLGKRFGEKEEETPRYR